MARSEKWLVYLKTGVSGPHDQAGLSELFRRGELTAATRIKPENSQRWLIISQVPEVWQPLKSTGAAPPQVSTPLKQNVVGKQAAAAPCATRLTDSDELFTFDDPLEESSTALPERGNAPASRSEHRGTAGPPLARNEGPGRLPQGSLSDPLSRSPPFLDPLRSTFATLGPGDYLNLDEEPEVAKPVRQAAPARGQVKRGFFDIPAEPSRRVVLLLLIILLGPFLLLWALMLLLTALNGLIELLEPSELTLHRRASGLEVATLFATECNGGSNFPDIGGSDRELASL
jgi:hypothetical protein